MSSNLVTLDAVPELTKGTTPPDDNNWFGFPVENFNPQEAVTLGSDTMIIPDGQSRSSPVVDVAYTGTLNALLVAGKFDLFMEALFGGSWTADKLVMGTAVPTFSIQRHNSYITTNPYWVYEGFAVNTMTVGFAYGGNITISFGFVGMGLTKSATSLIGTGSTTPVGEYTFMTAASGVTDVEVDGSAVASDVVIREWNLTVARNLVETRGAGTPIGPKGPPDHGSFTVTGNFNVYHTDTSDAWQDRAKANTPLDLKLKLTDGTKSYTVDTPNLKISGPADPTLEGQDQKNMVNMPFVGDRDATEQSVVAITRVP